MQLRCYSRHVLCCFGHRDWVCLHLQVLPLLSTWVTCPFSTCFSMVAAIGVWFVDRYFDQYLLKQYYDMSRERKNFT